jgi:hypothetical protein
MRDPGPVEEAFKSGDRRTALESLRDRICEEIDGVPCCRCGLQKRPVGSETSALVLRLIQVMDELNSVPTEGEVSNVANIRDAREERRKRALGQ